MGIQRETETELETETEKRIEKDGRKRFMLDRVILTRFRAEIT